jgi:hypothetical protein
MHKPILRLVIGLSLFAIAAAGAGLFLGVIPTAAAAEQGQFRGQTIHLAPPGHAPTLAPKTPTGPAFPPFDLGPLGAKATATPTSPPASNNEVVIENTFDQCAPIEDEFLTIKCEDGQLAFTRHETKGTRWIYYKPVLTDAMIEVTARLPSQKNARYGVIFRLSDDQKNFYLLGVSNEGKYGLFRFAGDHYETILPYTESFNVGNASFPTKIKIVNQGDVIAINLGGEWVDSVRDPNLQAGQVALFVEPDEPDQTVLFDDLRVTDLKSPVEVPEPRVVTPEATATPTGSGGFNLPGFNVATATPAPQQPTAVPATQTPFIIVVTATPRPATAVPSRAPTRKPTQAACPVGSNEAGLVISNNYIGYLMRFTIGGGDWGTHDYDVPGDGKWYLIRMPPGNYTYTASIAGLGTAHGEKKQYSGGQCYQLRFSP